MRLGSAYNRVWQMTITRLRAEGERWKLWHRINEGSGKKSYYPEKFWERQVMRFLDHTADYEIHPHIMQAYKTSLSRSATECVRCATQLPATQPGPTQTHDTDDPMHHSSKRAASPSPEGRRVRQALDVLKAIEESSDDSEDEWQL